MIAATDQPVISGTKLYVDGQEMRPAALTTNYTDGTGVTNYEVDTYYLNTCEWGNKTHTLFATAECESGHGDAVNSGPVATGHGVSPFVSVLFSNLITRISFSQPSFDPSSGQTQQISAVFAANCDWTLNVADIHSNIVFTTTGSGSSMSYNWNGTGNGGTNLPTGIYYYYINAETNGEADEIVGGGSGGGGSPPSPDFALSSFANTSELWALSSDSDDAVPLILYPPGFNTNSLSIFSATPAQVNAARASVFSASFSSADSGGSFSPDDAGGGSSADSQDSSASPQRQPANPIVGISGLYGVAWDTYTADGTNSMSAPTIPNEPGINGSYIGLDGYPGNAHLTYAPLPQFNAEVGNFETEMQLFGWKHTITKADDQLHIGDLQGSGTPFNNVSLGVLLTHGAYGTNQDYMAGLVKQMYFPITSGGSIQYLRMTDMNLGGSDPTNGLKWFLFFSCDSLHQANWTSMKNGGHVPYNSNLHMILGANSVISTSPTILQKWAQYMNFGRTNNVPMTIRDAFYQAAQDAYSGGHYTNTMFMATAYDTACVNDYLPQGFNNAPQGTWTYEQVKVWPLP